jgi:hypothetical protein
MKQDEPYRPQSCYSVTNSGLDGVSDEKNIDSYEQMYGFEATQLDANTPLGRLASDPTGWLEYGLDAEQVSPPLSLAYDMSTEEFVYHISQKAESILNLDNLPW